MNQRVRGCATARIAAASPCHLDAAEAALLRELPLAFLPSVAGALHPAALRTSGFYEVLNHDNLVLRAAGGLLIRLGTGRHAMRPLLGPTRATGAALFSRAAVGAVLGALGPPLPCQLRRGGLLPWQLARAPVAGQRRAPVGAFSIGSWILTLPSGGRQ